jgi:glycine betaine/proline transport system substrate-binding protein
MLALTALCGTALGQQVPPLETPDITNLIAPAASAAADDAAAGDGGAAADATEAAAPPPCGTQPISIARMTWPSAALLAEIHARLLKAQFGCTVQVIPSDMAPALSGMAATGQPAVAPELWIDRVAEQWNQAAKGQKLRQVGLSYAEAQFEGWYVPDYVAEAHPELKSAAALKDDWQLFASSGAAKARFISCPADWACAVINRNLIKAEGLADLFDIVEPKNRYDLDQTIAAAISRKQPVLFYYWQPNAALAQFGFRPVDLGPFSKDDFACLGKRNCPDPKPSSFAVEPVVIALAQWVFTGAPEIAAYFQRAQMPMAEMNKLRAELSEPGATVETVADRFVAERQDVWQRWVGTPIAAPASPADDQSVPPDQAAPPRAPDVAPPATGRPPPQREPPPRIMNDLPPPSLTHN